MKSSTKERIKYLVKTISISFIVFFTTVLILLIPIALLTDGVLTILLSSFTGPLAIYVTVPVLMRVDKIKFLGTDMTMLSSSVQFLLVSGMTVFFCEILQWEGIINSSFGIVILSIISMVVSYICGALMTRCLLTMYDL